MIMTSSDILVDDANWCVLGRTDNDVRSLVKDIVESTALSWEQTDRRVDERYAYPKLLTITPIAEGERVVPNGEPVHVVGKWLAEGGLDFFHQMNLPFRRAIASFQGRTGDNSHLILDISWSRFLQPGWYDSGGRFTHVVQPAESADKFPDIH